MTRPGLRYIRRVRAAAPAALVAILLLALPGSTRAAPASSEITEDTVRTQRSGTHVVTFWWLPFEYWMAVAAELKRTPAQISEVRSLFRNYTFLAAIDVEIRSDGSFDALSTAELVRRAQIDVNGSTQEVLRQVDRRMQELAPDLSYLLRTSLAHLGSAVRLLPLPNLGADGKPLLAGSEPGTMRVRYRVGSEGEEAEFWWHAPLTAVNGAKRCKSGELAEASWRFCPWDGTPIEE